MTINLDRRHFLGASTLAAGLAGLPAYARMPLAPKARLWNPVLASMHGFVDKKYVPGAVAAIGYGTKATDFLCAGELAFDN